VCGVSTLLVLLESIVNIIISCAYNYCSSRKRVFPFSKTFFIWSSTLAWIFSGTWWFKCSTIVQSLKLLCFICPWNHFLAQDGFPHKLFLNPLLHSLKGLVFLIIQAGILRCNLQNLYCEIQQLCRSWQSTRYHPIKFIPQIVKTSFRWFKNWSCARKALQNANFISNDSCWFVCML